VPPPLPPPTNIYHHATPQDRHGDAPTPHNAEDHPTDNVAVQSEPAASPFTFGRSTTGNPLARSFVNGFTNPFGRPLASFFQAPPNAHVFGAPSPYLWSPTLDDQSSYEEDEEEEEEEEEKDEEKEEEEEEPEPVLRWALSELDPVDITGSRSRTPSLRGIHYDAPSVDHSIESVTAEAATNPNANISRPLGAPPTSRRSGRSLIHIRYYPNNFHLRNFSSHPGFPNEDEENRGPNVPGTTGINGSDNWPLGP
jgi:hypothetical protein